MRPLPLRHVPIGTCTTHPRPARCPRLRRPMPTVRPRLRRVSRPHHHVRARPDLPQRVGPEASAVVVGGGIAGRDRRAGARRARACGSSCSRRRRTWAGGSGPGTGAWPTAARWSSSTATTASSGSTTRCATSCAASTRTSASCATSAATRSRAARRWAGSPRTSPRCRAPRCSTSSPSSCAARASSCASCGTSTPTRRWRCCTTTPSRTYAEHDHRSAAELLDSLGFSDRGRAMLFEVFAHSFFNVEQRYSAAEFLAMCHFYFTATPRAWAWTPRPRTTGPRCGSRSPACWRSTARR